jgi:hypothetical protein
MYQPLLAGIVMATLVSVFGSLYAVCCIKFILEMTFLEAAREHFIINHKSVIVTWIGVCVLGTAVIDIALRFAS